MSNTNTGHAITYITYRMYKMLKCKKFKDKTSKNIFMRQRTKIGQRLVTFLTMALPPPWQDRLVSDLRAPSLTTSSEESVFIPHSGQAAVSRVGELFCHRTK